MEWWRATQPRLAGTAHSDIFPLMTRSQAFRSAREWILTTRGKTWQERARGPVSDALVWLEVAGWTADAPAVWRARAGGNIVLTEVPPAVIRTWFVRDVTQQKFKSMVDKKLQDFDPPSRRRSRPRGFGSKQRGRRI
eukprot:5691601-Pyramimonas_sp.AAC.1